MTDLLFMPAVQAAALIHAKKLSPVEQLQVSKAIRGSHRAMSCQ